MLVKQKNGVRVSLVALIFLLMNGCQLSAKSQALPAHLAEPSDEVFAEISAVIKQALNGVEVRLSKQLFKDSSWLIIERSQRKNIQNSNLLGRTDEMPIRFQLFKKGDKCVIKKSDSKTLWMLKLAKCNPIKKTLKSPFLLEIWCKHRINRKFNPPQYLAQTHTQFPKPFVNNAA